MSAYFVTAVGTGIGKTFTTCALVHASNGKALGYKPVISGYDDSDTTDTAQIILAENQNRLTGTVSPWRFKAPLSPHMAAPKENKRIDVNELIGWTQDQAKNTECFIETVGGVMVPLNEKETTLDWMKACKLPVILVTGSYLGSISHTLSAIEVLKQAKLEVKALVMNESEGGIDFAEAQTGLAPFIQTIPLRIFQPRVSSWKEAQEIHALLSQL